MCWPTPVSGGGFGERAAYTWVENSHEFDSLPGAMILSRTPPGAFYIRMSRPGGSGLPPRCPRAARRLMSFDMALATPFRAHRKRHRLGVVGLCGHGRPGKFTVLKMRNVSGRPRRLSLTGYWEWVLGDLRQKNLLHVQTEVDLKTGALLARNYYNTEFRIAWCSLT